MTSPWCRTPHEMDGVPKAALIWLIWSLTESKLQRGIILAKQRASVRVTGEYIYLLWTVVLHGQIELVLNITQVKALLTMKLLKMRGRIARGERKDWRYLDAEQDNRELSNVMHGLALGYHIGWAPNRVSL